MQNVCDFMYFDIANYELSEKEGKAIILDKTTYNPFSYKKIGPVTTFKSNSDIITTNYGCDILSGFRYRNRPKNYVYLLYLTN